MLDQITKMIASMFLKSKVTLIFGFLELELRHNTGISWGIFANLGEKYYNQVVLATFIGLLILALYYITASKSWHRAKKVGMRLILCGGISNLVDRLMYGRVVDMLSVSFFGFNLFVCNLADIYISIGVLLYAIYSRYKQPKSNASVYAEKYNLQKEKGL